MKNQNIGIIAFIFVGIVFLSFKKSKSIPEQVAEIHARCFTVDTHTDTPMRFTRKGFDIGVRNEESEGGGKVDLVRMKEGGLDGIFFAVFLGQGALNEGAYKKVQTTTETIFDSIYSAVNNNQNLASIALTSDDAYEIKGEGKRAIYIGIENGYPIANDLSKVEHYYKRGARYITLCHSSNNQLADSSTDKKGAVYNGLSPMGEEVVKEMNRLGMMIDISHASDSTLMDVVRLSKAPIIASHSCAREICNHPRNISDDLLQEVKKNGGVVQLCLLSDYIKSIPQNPKRKEAREAVRKEYGDYYSLEGAKKEAFLKDWYAIDKLYPVKQATVSDAVDHIDHIVATIGIDHVGIGSDFDGGGGLADCSNVSEMKNITAELLTRGYSEEQIKKIWGGNFLRVMKEVETLAAK